MRYTTRPPDQPLAPYVDYLWYLRDTPTHSTERIVPTGTLELVVNLHEDAVRVHDSRTGQWRRYSGAVVSGAHQRYFVADTRAHAAMVGVHFKPGGALPFLGIPPGELADQHVDLELLWGRAAVDLRDRLCLATTTAARFAELNRALRSRLPLSAPGHRALPFALEQLARPEVTVGQVAASVELSHRRFIQVFTAEVGMPPKRLSRILRFQRVSELARAGTPDWRQVAVACGYFDQSHLINEVGELTGATPVEMVRASARVKEFHLVDEGSIFSKTSR
ncbi:DUF6597 domain-containing transcriptional factor [Nocardia sp. NPDC050406]|uniref:DUF6597 domain-containing transcriptional factor n=1 Tax=Nocardia sp. NPDC050406 TaxID=3364318 RepID=UPI00378856A0